MAGKWLISLTLLTALSATAQTALSVSPSAVNFSGVTGRYLDVPKTVAVSAQGRWSARIEGAPQWLSINPASGAGPGSFTVSLVDWAAVSLPEGTHAAEISVSEEGSSTIQAVKVTATMVKAIPAPKFTYLNGPHHCVRPDGYEDEATCTVPDEKPPGSFVAPQRGGSYIDPNFGAVVRVITDPPTAHSYSSPSALSAGNKYALVHNMSGRFSVVSPLNGEIKARDVPAAEERGTMWDADDPEVFYVIRQRSVVKYDLRTRALTTVADYSNGTLQFAEITAGGAGDTSKDNWLSFFAPREKRVCALDLKTANTYCASYENLGRVTLDPSGRGTLITKGVDSASGKRYVLLVAAPAMAFFSVNVAERRLNFEFLGPEILGRKGNNDGVCDPGEACLIGEHGDTFEDANGIQYLVTSFDPATPCSYGVFSFQINKGAAIFQPAELGGGLRRLVTLYRCGGADPWADIHMGCAKKASMCVVSTTYGGLGYQKDVNDPAPIKRTAHLSEILVVKDNGAEVRRLVQHRSVPLSTEPAQSYWSTPRACISGDGSYVVADSNFGEPNRQRVVVIETGYGKTKIASLTDAASYRERVSPGGMATIFGANLANCNGSVDAFPLPSVYCGTSVMFGNSAARFYYVSTGQLNVLVPSSAPTGGETVLRVSRGADPLDFDTVLLPGSAISPSAPAMFAYFLEDGIGRAVVQNTDPQTGGMESLNGPEIPGVLTGPQVPGRAAVLYAINLGPTNPPVADGLPAPVDPLARTNWEVEVYINGTRQPVFYSGLTPTLSGLYQVNYILSPATPLLSRDDNKIWLRVNGADSSALTINVASR